MKHWRPFFDSCLNCGGDAEVLTDSGEDNVAYDGDDARCSQCGLPGQVIAYEENGYISWHDEPGCECEWCSQHAEEAGGDS